MVTVRVGVRDLHGDLDGLGVFEKLRVAVIVLDALFEKNPVDYMKTRGYTKHSVRTRAQTRQCKTANIAAKYAPPRSVLQTPYSGWQPFLM